MAPKMFLLRLILINQEGIPGLLVTFYCCHNSMRLKLWRKGTNVSEE